MTDTKLKMITGFCKHGFCEGTRPHAPSGRAVRTCPYWDSCPCKCHELMDQMFEIAGRERILVENPEYVHFESPFWMPDAEWYAARMRSNGVTGTDGQPTSEDAANGNVAPITAGFQPTPTGRLARGELEAKVLAVVTQWGTCTPAFISEQIDPDDPPSTGAVTAVLIRWVKIGFGTMSTKPIRFTGVTPEGQSKGLAVMKSDYHRGRARDKAQLNRGYR